MKAFLEVSLISLTVLSFYWFAAQQRTSTLKQRKVGSSNAKFSSEFNEISLFFLKATGRGSKDG